ncbi:MAG: hypothetical protein ACXW04_09950 [Methylobacter sp.]
MTKHRQQTYLKGKATHRRTETDYLSVLLETVTLDDWREVVTQALQEAKNGDKTARDWLARYLVGIPQTHAPAPLTVVVQQLKGDDPLVDNLAKPVIDQALYPSFPENDEWEEHVKTSIATELAKKIPQDESDSKSVTALLSEKKAIRNETIP